METKLKEAVYLYLFLLVWEQTIWLGSCASIESSGDADTFSIHHSASGRCVVADSSRVSLGECGGPGASAWKWGSAHRLFHVPTARCLGVELRSKALALLSCGSTGDSMLWWQCRGGAVYTNYQMGLTTAGEVVRVKHDSSDVWTRHNSTNNICHKPYRVIHTTDGNSAGSPCEFPFLHNGSWFHQCLPADDSPLSWCSTTPDYQRDQKKGYCLLPEEGCGGRFQGPKEGPCYELVFHSAVSWQEAEDACRSQGAHLLSLSSQERESFPIPDGGHNIMPERVWVGLHQLRASQGWQWSDESPLSYLRWEPGMPPSSSLTESDCGVMNAQHNYEAEACGARLPYICKKTLSSSGAPEFPGSTVCADGWSALNGWCYRLVQDAARLFSEAQRHCESLEGHLASLHSVDAVEMIHNRLHTGAVSGVWIGLMGGENPAVFHWTDETPVNFTFWGRGQPQQPSGNSSCVFFSGQSHGWSVGDCNQGRSFLCKKEGQVNQSASEAGCPPNDGWRRHGDSCYKVDPREVPFRERCDLIIRNSFQQGFLTQLLKEQPGGGTRFFWTSLQDVNNTGEFHWVSQTGPEQPVTYTNWGWNQPEAMAGGCAVMSTSVPVGKWELRNCSEFQAGSICRRDVSTPPLPDPLPDPLLPCPDGWVSRKGISYCYKVFVEERLGRKRSWEEAERFCQALGANLPSFTHPEEMTALHLIMRDSISNDRFFWVGLNRRDPADHYWQWSDGRPVSMSVLDQDIHQDDEYDRDCMAFKTTSGALRSLLHLLFFDLPSRLYSATPFHCDAKLEWVCQIPKGRTPETPEWYNPGGHHDTSVFIHGAELWYVKEPRLPYEEAALYCSSNSSQLARLRSLDAVRLINAHLPTMPDPMQSWWADLREPGRFFPMRMSQFHRSFLGRCTSIRQGRQSPEYEHRCERRLPFVCERLNTTLVERNPLEPHPLGLPCRNKSVAFRDKCYTVIQPRDLTFREANEHCHSLAGTLLSVSDQVEQDFVTSLLPGQPQSTWIGLKLRHLEPQWVDGTAVSFLNFNPLIHGLVRPMLINTLNPESTELCVFVSNDPHSDMLGSWDYTTCSDHKKLFLCQHYADRPEEPSVSPEPFQVDQHTFQLLHQNLTWFQGVEACRALGMGLASVAGTLQQAALSVRVTRAGRPMWIGLFSEDEGVHYRWTDHSHTLFSRWSSEPSRGSCVYLDLQGFWRARQCEDVLGGAVCHTPSNETVATPEETAVKCPHKMGGPNWVPFRKNCYTFQLESSRWDEFNKGQIHHTCKKLDAGADILTIRTAEENMFVREQLKPFRHLVQFVWLGVFMDDNEDAPQMRWYDGTNVQFSNWREGRPDVQGDFMAALNTDGVWEIFTNKRLFSPLKQRSIVACKLEQDSKEQYNHSISAYERYGNLSYAVVRRKLSWFEALQECGARGGHLASVHDPQHDAHLGLIARTDGFPLWIGLSSQEVGAPQYEWSDGTRYDYQPGVSAPPRAPGPGPRTPDPLTPDPQPPGSCVYLTPTGGWSRADCQARMEGAVCYNTSITTPSQRATPQVSPTANSCPRSSGRAQWVEFQDHCYAFDMIFYNYSVYSMEKARSICLGLDAQVLSIKTREENDFVREYMEEHPLITSRVWLGLDLDTQGHPVSWMDGSPVGFTNFGPVGRVSGGGGPGCVVLVSGEGGVWSTVSCQESHSRAVCKTTAGSRGSPVALAFFILVLLALLAAVIFVVYKKLRLRSSSTVRYRRNFDEADTTSIITEDD